MAKRKPPDYLSDAARRWVRQVDADYELEDHHFKILCAAAHAWDRTEKLRERIDKMGLIVTDRYKTKKPNPLLVTEKDQKILFARLVRELALDAESSEPSRPPRR